MSTALSKRHQARNERALQDLIKTVPGNDRCADCGARNPGWASWSLGIFLCMRCASLHRQLGTHISKVKSLSMDSWSNEQVESMKRNGNVTSNRTFNPKNAKPEVPLDVDEVDATLARFIKQKYDQQLFSGGHTRPLALRTDTGNTGNTGSTRSSEDQPPPLPPKPGKRFGFGGLRSVSSALPLSRNHHKSPPQSPQSSNGGFEDPIRVNKQSRVFGTSVGGGGSENIEAKLAQLRDMGFGDDRRNLNVLKGHNGDVERAIETLVRVGEGSNPASRSRTPASTRNIAVSQPFPPTTQPSSTTNGLSFESRGATVSQTNTGSTGPLSSQSSAAFPDPPPVQPQPQVRSFSVGNPYQTQTQHNHNPFGMPPPQQHQQQQSGASTPLDHAFQGMQLSQQLQQPPLFPNATGGYPNLPPHAQDPRLQTMTPPIPQMPQQLNQSNPYAQQNQQINGTQNPFYSQSQQFQPPQTNPYLPNAQQNIQQPQQQSAQPQIFSQSYNPFGQQPIQHPQPNGYQSPQAYSPMTQQGGWGQSQTQSPQVQQGGFSQAQSPTMQQGGFSQNQTPQVQQGAFQQPQPMTQNPYAALLQQPQQPQQPSQHPQQQQNIFAPQQPFSDPVQHGNQNQPQTQQQQQQPQSYNPYQPMPLQPQQTGRFGKNDILALYNYPQLAPPPLPQIGENQQQAQNAEAVPGPSLSPGRRSATMPALFPSGSNNPFGSAAPKPQPSGLSVMNAGAPSINRHASQESVDVGGLQNGRHSPDAFASLSASFAR